MTMPQMATRQYRHDGRPQARNVNLLQEAETAFRNAAALYGVDSAEALVALWHWKRLRRRKTAFA